MSKINKISPGDKFGLWTVVRRVENNKCGQAMYECVCACGTRRKISSSKLKTGCTNSCGCGERPALQKHMMSHTRLHNIWVGMKQRCNNKNNVDYANYGARGISVCDAWNNDFSTFMDWALRNGYNDCLTIERTDVNAGYSPSNCKWIPKCEQTGNRRNTVYLSVNGVTKTLVEWSKETGIPYSTLYRRKVLCGYEDRECIVNKRFRFCPKDRAGEYVIDYLNGVRK